MKFFDMDNLAKQILLCFIVGFQISLFLPDKKIGRWDISANKIQWGDL